MIDVDHQINAVRRTVGTRVLEAGEARTVTLSQTYAADIDDVWDACTNPERIPRWFMAVSGELRLGGHYQLERNAGGTIETCDPPSHFTATWEYGGEVSWIELSLTSEPDGGTRFSLEHIGRVDDTRWTEYGPGARPGTRRTSRPARILRRHVPRPIARRRPTPRPPAERPRALTAPPRRWSA
jgi:uncharacterized protein YndB with AHSA1/START domain